MLVACTMVTHMLYSLCLLALRGKGTSLNVWFVCIDSVVHRVRIWFAGYTCTVLAAVGKPSCSRLNHPRLWGVFTRNYSRQGCPEFSCASDWRCNFPLNGRLFTWGCTSKSTRREEAPQMQQKWRCAALLLMRSLWLRQTSWPLCR